jgi:TolB-like protein/DNA-binding winged helix-turn-helix (wHTH) protein/Tfp pilus assembly protein PilF
MNGRVYRFAEFELRAAESELRNGSAGIRLQEKPLLLLVALLDHPQNLVTRDQLRERLWDHETFVDYELGINAAVKKLRDALGDSVENPRFIQTVTRKGYRWLTPVEVVGPGKESTADSLPSATSPDSVSKPGPRAFSQIGWGLASLATAIVIVAGLAFLRWHKEEHRPKPIRSLAVLPLRNLSPDPGQDYFADGITEELITDLAQSLPLRVISRTSVMRYRQTSEPITQIARELDVDAVVEGAVARSGRRVTVTVQLIDATEDRHLWAKEFDRNVEDILGIEAELSQEIAGQVSGALAPAPNSKPVSPHPADAEVYDLCLLGRYFWNKRTPAGLTRSIDYFQRAIHRDPNYAPAYAGLAEGYVILPSYDSVVPADSFSKARMDANRAIELDDTLADAHAVLAFVALNYWATDRTIAEHEFKRALQLNPNYTTAHQWFAFYLTFEGRTDEAIAEMERARQLDPLSAIINADEGHMLYASGRKSEARLRLQQAIELEPDFGQPHETLALIDLEEGHGTDALGEARAGLKLDSTNPRTMAEAGYVLAVTGHTGEARKMLATLNELDHRGGNTSPDFQAFIYLGLGDRDRAIDVIAQTETRKVGAGLRALQQWPIFNQLKGDPRYQKLMAAAWQ